MNKLPSGYELKEKTSPDKWKWYGYYNKEDKRAFIWGRKGGLGWTVNFANPYGRLSVLLILLFPLILMLYGIFHE